MIHFTVYGEPSAQGRPRFARRGNFVKAYDPQKSKDYKDTIYSIALQHRPQSPLPGPVSVRIGIYKNIPKSFSKKRRVASCEFLERPITKPDIDNYVKGVFDALKGLIWVDDGQVVSMIVDKYYSDTPRMEVEVRQWEAGQS